MECRLRKVWFWPKHQAKGCGSVAEPPPGLDNIHQPARADLEWGCSFVVEEHRHGVSQKGQRSIEGCQADHFSFCDVRTVWLAFGRIEKRPSAVNDAGFLPFATQDVCRFIGNRMRVGRNGGSSVEFSQHRHTTGGFMAVKHHQLDTRIGTGLPRFTFSRSDVWKHGLIQRWAARIASVVLRGRWVAHERPKNSRAVLSRSSAAIEESEQAQVQSDSSDEYDAFST